MPGQSMSSRWEQILARQKWCSKAVMFGRVLEEYGPHGNACLICSFQSLSHTERGQHVGSVPAFTLFRGPISSMFLERVAAPQHWTKQVGDKETEEQGAGLQEGQAFSRRGQPWRGAGVSVWEGGRQWRTETRKPAAKPGVPEQSGEDSLRRPLPSGHWVLMLPWERVLFHLGFWEWVSILCN